MARAYCSVCGDSDQTMIAIRHKTQPFDTILCRQCCDEKGYKITVISEAEAKAFAAEKGIDIDDLLER